jgi:uncharacterized Tic20 family protein
MRSDHHIAMRHDNQLIVLMHLSQLVTLVIGFGSLIVPLIIWSVNKDRVYELNEHKPYCICYYLYSINPVFRIRFDWTNLALYNINHISHH